MSDRTLVTHKAIPGIGVADIESINVKKEDMVQPNPMSGHPIKSVVLAIEVTLTEEGVKKFNNVNG